MDLRPSEWSTAVFDLLLLSLTRKAATQCEQQLRGLVGAILLSLSACIKYKQTRSEDKQRELVVLIAQRQWRDGTTDHDRQPAIR
jgi:hypothetical protein